MGFRQIETCDGRKNNRVVPPSEKWVSTAVYMRRRSCCTSSGFPISLVFGQPSNKNEWLPQKMHERKLYNSPVNGVCVCVSEDVSVCMELASESVEL